MKKLFAHTTGAVLEAGLIAVLAIGLVAGSALAGKPAPGGSTSTFRVDDGVFAGQTTAYAGSSTSTTVHARCYQGGALVFEQYATYSDGKATLTLGPTPRWSGGAATCTAEDGYWFRMTRWRILATTTFNVSA